MKTVGFTQKERLAFEKSRDEFDRKKYPQFMFEMLFPKLQSFAINMELYAHDLEQALLGKDVKLAGECFEQVLQCYYLFGDMWLSVQTYQLGEKYNRQAEVMERSLTSSPD